MLLMVGGFSLVLSYIKKTHPFYCREHYSLSETTNSADLSLPTLHTLKQSRKVSLPLLTQFPISRH